MYLGSGKAGQRWNTRPHLLFPPYRLLPWACFPRDPTFRAAFFLTRVDDCIFFPPRDERQKDFARTVQRACISNKPASPGQGHHNASILLPRLDWICSKLPAKYIPGSQISFHLLLHSLARRAGPLLPPPLSEPDRVFTSILRTPAQALRPALQLNLSSVPWV